MIKITSKLLFKFISNKEKEKGQFKRTLDYYFLKKKIIKAEMG